MLPLCNLRLLCGIPDPLYSPKFDLKTILLFASNSFSEFHLRALQRGPKAAKWLLWGLVPYSVLALRRVWHPGFASSRTFSCAFMVWLPSLRLSPHKALRSYFISQRSWDSPFRVFPSLPGRSSLKMIPSSHCVGLKALPRSVKSGFTSKRRIQSIDPNNESVRRWQDVTLVKSPMLFWGLPFWSFPRPGNKKDFAFFPLAGLPYSNSFPNPLGCLLRVLIIRTVGTIS